MTTGGTMSGTAGEPRAPALDTTPLLLAALASAGAGLVHAAAAGSHQGDRTLAVMFALAAAVQLGWAAAALARSSRVVAGIGVAANAGLVAVWALTRTVGVPGVAVLGVESVGLQDLVAAALAVTSVAGALWWLGEGRLPRWLAGSWTAPAVAVLVAAIAVPAMAAGHAHDDQLEVASPPAESPDTSAVGFVDEPPADGAPGAEPAGEGPDGDPADDHDHGPDGPIISLYDPRVTPDQRAAARDLIDRTAAGMTRFGSIDDVIAEGYVSIGDGSTGFEHFINLRYVIDGVELDPERIESIVAEVKPDGSRELVSAMYLLSPGSTMEDVPEIAGPLTAWHDHQNLCWEGIRVVGTTGPDGSCRRGEFRGTSPMLHVWLVPHPCGPFAGLEGHGGGCAHDEH